MANTTDYDFELCKEICELLYDNISLTEVLKKDKRFPARSTFFLWKREHKELSDLYNSVQQDRGELLIDNIDKTLKELREGKLTAQEARVMIDADKWKASKYYPKMFGDRTIISGDEDNQINVKLSIDPIEWINEDN